VAQQTESRDVRQRVHGRHRAECNARCVLSQSRRCFLLYSQVAD
jgi:hypothetical protein